MVIGQFYPVVGGAEQQCRKLSRALIERGNVVSVLTTKGRDTKSREVVDGIPVERFSYPIGLLAPFFLFLRLLFIIRRYDVLHVHQGLWPLMSSICIAAIFGKPIICKIGNSGERFDLHVLRRSHWGYFGDWIIRRFPPHFVWTSNAVRNDLQRAGFEGETVTHIPNGVEIPKLHSKRGVYTVRKEKSNVGFIFTGTFSRKKNLGALITAVSMLPSSYRERLSVTLLGGGKERSRLHRMIEECELTQTIIITGPVDDVQPFLLSHDVFVLPSVTEGLSNAALEAMANGLPVLLSNRGGNRDLVSGENFSDGIVVGNTGMLIDLDNPTALRDALKLSIDDPHLRKQMGDEAARFVEMNYSISRIVNSYEALYRRLCTSDHIV
jgi:glycosyltransferase involved in cell wall biosynthesis